jgi:hypothetical protein
MNTRGSPRASTTHIRGASNYQSWADAADSADESSLVEARTSTPPRSNTTPVPSGSARAWTDVVSNRTTSQVRRRTNNILGNRLNRGVGTSVASQSLQSATSVNSDVSAVTTATVLQLQSQVRELQQTQDRKLEELKTQNESEIQELRAEHITETEDLYEAIQAIKSQIQELLQNSRAHTRPQNSVPAIAPDLNVAAPMSARTHTPATALASGTTALAVATTNTPESPPQLSAKRSLSGSKKPRVSSSPQSNRFELLSESMDDDEDLEEVEFFPQPSQDEVMASNDETVNDTAVQVRLLNIQQSQEPDPGSNGEGMGPC